MSDTHAQTAAYVRTTMVPEQAPPATEVGVLKWLRENLFSSWLNALLTIASIYVIYWAVSHTMPWMLGGIWQAESLTDCRAIRDAATPEGMPVQDVACWAVLTDRWHQLVFGYFPIGQYWRPIVALGIFLVGAIPVMFPAAPRALFAVTALVPFAVFWLIWGGTIWYPVSLILVFVVGYGVYRAGLLVTSSALAILAGIVAGLAFWLFGAAPVSDALSSAVPVALESVTSRQVGGFTLALVIGLSSITLSLPLGILLALGRQSDMFIINKFCVGFIETIRGVPLIVWLFTAQLLLNYFLPPGTAFDLVLRVIIMVTLFASAYIAEVIRGGLAALPKGQYEGADSLGLNYWQSMRLIVLPQALKISIPGIVNTFIGLFKDTTLVVFIGLSDPIGVINLIRADTDWNGIYWELYIFVGLMFFFACYAMSRYSLYLERKLQREHR